MSEHNLALARERSQSPTPFVPAVLPADRRRLRLNALVNMLAADSYRAESELMGVSVVEPWSALDSAQQRVYLKRVRALLASGIGHAHSKAERLAVRQVSEESGVFASFPEPTAKAIEAMFAKVIAAYEAQLVAQFQELGR